VKSIDLKGKIRRKLRKIATCANLQDWALSGTIERQNGQQSHGKRRPVSSEGATHAHAHAAPVDADCGSRRRHSTSGRVPQSPASPPEHRSRVQGLLRYRGQFSSFAYSNLNDFTPSSAGFCANVQLLFTLNLGISI
jgi:hypothetical protein